MRQGKSARTLIPFQGIFALSLFSRSCLCAKFQTQLGRHDAHPVLKRRNPPILTGGKELDPIQPLENFLERLIDVVKTFVQMFEDVR